MHKIEEFAKKYKKIYHFTCIVLFTGSALIVASILSYSYFRFYPDNFQENEKQYNLIANFLLDKKIDGIIDYDIKDKKSCTGIIKCDCLEKACILEGKDLYEYMGELKIKNIYVRSSLSGVVTFTPQKRFWSATEMYYNFYKSGFDYLNNKKYPFYAGRSGGYVYDKQLSNNWSITRDGYLRGFYITINRY